MINEKVVCTHNSLSRKSKNMKNSTVQRTTLKQFQHDTGLSSEDIQILLRKCFAKNASGDPNHRESYGLNGFIYWIQDEKQSSIQAVCTLVPPSFSEPLWMVYNVCVDPKEQGHGMGALLIGKVIEDWTKMTSQEDPSVPTSQLGLDCKVCNLPALRLYIRSGFVPVKCFQERNETFYRMIYSH